MLRHIVFLVVVVSVSLAFSWLLIPRDQELALMHYKARSYRDALAGFESAFFASDRRDALATPLTALYLRQGDLEGAVDVVERLLVQRPGDIEALDLALDLYRELMMTERYHAVLWRRVRLAPSAALVRELVDIEAFRGDPLAEIEALSLIVDEPAARPAELLRLVRLQVAVDSLSDAAQTLDAWVARGRPELDIAALGVALAVYVEIGREAQAADTLIAWLDRNARPDAIAGVATLVERFGLARTTAAPLRAFVARQAPVAPLLGPVHDLAVILDQPALFTDFVARARAAAPDAPAALRIALEAALVSGQTATLGSVLDAAALRDVDPGAAARLAATVAGSEDAALARALLAVLPAQVRMHAPLSWARLAVAAGEDGQARAIAQTLDAAALEDTTQRVQLIALLQALGLQERARDLLAATTAVTTPDGDLAIELARLHRALGSAGTGLARLGDGLAGSARPAAQEAWALLAAAAGEGAAVADWLNAVLASRGRGPGLDVLAALADSTAISGEPVLRAALAAALERQPADAGKDPRVARVLVALGRHEEALALLSGLDPFAAAHAGVYQRALLGAWRASRSEDDGPAQDALVRYVAAWQARHAGDTQALARFTYDLLDAGALRAARPLLDDLVRRDPEQWYDPWRDALLADGRREALLAALERQLAVGAGTLEARYLDDLARLGGVRRSLSFLARTVADPARDEQSRANAYYALRDAALAAGESAWLQARLFEWLDAADAPASLSEAWLYDLEAEVGAARVLALRERALRRARGARRLAAFYEFEASALAAGAPAQLAQVAADLLEAGTGDDALREAALNALFAHGQGRRADALLADAARRDPSRWGGSYLDRLAADADTATLRAFAAAQVGRDDLPPALRREFAERLLALGDKEAALAAFMRLAADRDVDDDAVAMLLYLWGPRPGPAAQAWVAQRARAASGRARAAWAQVLTALGGARTAADVLQAAAASGHPDPLIGDAYLDALLAAGEREAARAWLVTQQRAAATRPHALAWLAGRAAAADFSALALDIQQTLLAARPDDRSTLRRLGLAAFGAGQRGLAERYLQRYLAHVDDDPEAHFYYAEVLTEAGYRERALPHYRRVLALIEPLPTATFALRTLQAQALHRVGRAQAAISAFERLLGERPQADDLRADYVTMLLDDQRLRSAREVLAPPAVAR